MLSNSKTKIILGVAVVLVVFGQLGWLRLVQDFFLWFTKPVFTVTRGAAMSVANTVSNVFAIGSLQSENSDLKQRLVILEAENSQLKLLSSEIGQYEEVLNLRARTGYSLTGARVVSADPTSLNQTLIVDRGSQAGVIEGQAVVDASGALVGKISRVLRNTSEITLISDFTSRLPAEVAETGARGIISGQHGLAVALIEVPQGQNVQIDGRIVTTGFTPGVPPGLFVGYVDQMRGGGGDLFQEALIRTAADLRQLRVVFVITGIN